MLGLVGDFPAWWRMYVKGRVIASTVLFRYPSKSMSLPVF